MCQEAHDVGAHDGNQGPAEGSHHGVRGVCRGGPSDGMILLDSGVIAPQEGETALDARLQFFMDSSAQAQTAKPTAAKESRRRLPKALTFKPPTPEAYPSSSSHSTTVTDPAPISLPPPSAAIMILTPD
jgi:hypothetical protein